MNDQTEATAPAAAADAAAPAKPAREPNVKQNDVSKPSAGTKTGRVWDIADSISATNRRPALREEVMKACEAEGINRGTIATQYARWTQFHGVTKEQRGEVRQALKPAPTPAAPTPTEPAAEPAAE